MRSYLEPVKDLISILESDDGEAVGDDQWLAVEFPPSPSVDDLFQKRQVCVVVSDIEDEQHRLTPHYWFPSCAMEELAEDTEMVEPVVGGHCPVDSGR